MVAAMDNPDLARQIGNVVRLGTIASVDPGAATCRMAVGDIVTGDLPWLAIRAGTVRIWSPPTIGEQCVLLCAEGDTDTGIVIPGLFSDARPAPASEDSTLILFDDGARIAYRDGTLDIVLPGGGTARIDAPGGLTIAGDVTVTGKITPGDDVVAGTISVQRHRHDTVQAGGAISGAPL